MFPCIRRGGGVAGAFRGWGAAAGAGLYLQGLYLTQPLPGWRQQQLLQLPAFNRLSSFRLFVMNSLS